MRCTCLRSVHSVCRAFVYSAVKCLRATSVCVPVRFCGRIYVCMYLCIMHVCLYMCVYYVYMYIYIIFYIYIIIYACVYMCECATEYVCMYVYMYVCVCNTYFKNIKILYNTAV